jgi:hypothetical protein
MNLHLNFELKVANLAKNQHGPNITGITSPHRGMNVGMLSSLFGSEHLS